MNNSIIRKKRLRYNTVAAMFNQLINLVSSFVLPRLILIHYGSNVNGLITSITQFLGFITLMEMGVGAVVQSALYKPLATNDNDEISRIIASADKFFKRISKILIVYIIVLIPIFNVITNTSFDFLFVSLLIIVISISNFAQYFFGITNQLLLNADQKSYIHLLLNSCAIIANTGIGVALVFFDAPIIIVKLFTSLVLLIRPLGMYIYVKMNYEIDRKIKITNEPLKQKWNGLYHHLASFVLQHTDVAVLTILSTLENVSVYGIYQLVTNGLNQVITILTTGVQAMFGSLYAQNDQSLLEEYEKFEWLLHNAIILVFTTAGILICPFVMIYTKGADANLYYQPMFGFILVTAQAVCCLRMPYNIMVKAAGHYKETQYSALMEAILNILISLIFVYKLGLVGVAIGTLVAMGYRTVYLGIYVSKKIVIRDTKKFFKHIIVDVISVACICLFNYLLNLSGGVINYWCFILSGLKIVTVSILCLLGINAIFYTNQLKRICFEKSILRKIK